MYKWIYIYFLILHRRKSQKMTMKIEQERVMKWILDFFEAKTTDLYDDPTFFSFYVWEHKWIYRKLVQNPSGLIPLFICQPPMQTNTQRLYLMPPSRILFPTTIETLLQKRSHISMYPYFNPNLLVSFQHSKFKGYCLCNLSLVSWISNLSVSKKFSIIIKFKKMIRHLWSPQTTLLL